MINYDSAVGYAKQRHDQLLNEAETRRVLKTIEKRQSTGPVRERSFYLSISITTGELLIRLGTKLNTQQNTSTPAPSFVEG